MIVFSVGDRDNEIIYALGKFLRGSKIATTKPIIVLFVEYQNKGDLIKKFLFEIKANLIVFDFLV